MADNDSQNEIIESDDDCEVYFLKPVNEYNIMEKIKAANKELFSQDDCIKLNVESSTDSLILPNNRKVSFARNLEEYEPQQLTMVAAITNPIMTTGSVHFNDDNDNVDNIENSNGKFEQKLEKVIEEQEDLETETEREAEAEAKAKVPEEFCDKLEIIQAISQNECTDSINIVEKNLTENEIYFIKEDDVKEEYQVKSYEDEILEEICEEISVLNTEEDNNNNGGAPSYTNQRKIIKQITFDYGCFDEDNEQHLHPVEDNESLTNLLTLDNSDEGEVEEDLEIRENVKEEENINKDDAFNQLTNSNIAIDKDQTISLNSDELLLTNEKEKEEQDDGVESNEINSETDDDDQLSIIVASYIQDDYENIDKVSLTSDKCLLNQQNDNNNNNNNKNKTQGQQQRKKTFGKCFSFRRKIKKENMKRVKNENGSNDHSKLYYKTCCEYKNFQKKLPKYTGYLSEYGLSQEQLMERERKLQKRKFSLLQQTLRASEEELRKMQDNERAFVRWLKNKMRFPINRTRNMFDVKRPFGLRKLKRNNIDVEKNESKLINQENLPSTKQQQQPKQKHQQQYNQRKSCKIIKKPCRNEKTVGMSKKGPI